MSPSGGSTPVTAQDLTIAPLTITPDEIARFIADVYDTYPHGKAFVPRWTGPFLKHLIFDHPDFTPDHALGAFAGDRLVGLILAQPYVVHLDDEQVKAVFGSWLAVTPEGAAQFGAIKLIGQLKERLSARGAKVMIGIAYRAGPGVGLDFWEGFMRAFPKDISTGRDLKFWARVLDGSALAAAVKDPLLKVGGHAARLWPVRKPKHDPHIRDFQPNDLERCQQLLAQTPVRLRSAPTLWELQGAPNLEQGPQTLVLDEGSGPKALAMFHILPMCDAGPLGLGMIDHLVAPGGTKDQTRMLAATLWRLKEAGACLALLPQKPFIKSMPMLSRGFAPYAEEFKIFVMPFSDQVLPKMPASFDLLVR